MTQPEGREISFPTGHRRRDRSLPGATSLGEPSRGAPAPGGHPCHLLGVLAALLGAARARQCVP